LYSGSVSGSQRNFSEYTPTRKEIVVRSINSQEKMKMNPTDLQQKRMMRAKYATGVLTP
jgi:hypothetical protein